MSDRNGTPTFYENTMRLAAARCPRRFGTKMRQTSRIRKTIARVRRSFEGKLGQAAAEGANALAQRDAKS